MSAQCSNVINQKSILKDPDKNRHLKNIAGKGENADTKHFPLASQYF